MLHNNIFAVFILYNNKLSLGVKALDRALGDQVSNGNLCVQLVKLFFEVQVFLVVGFYVFALQT